MNRQFVSSMIITACVLGCGQKEQIGTALTNWDVERSSENPLLTVDTEGMVEEHGYGNVNGPSVIRVPSWVENPLGKYYMYFAHHRGSFIRLAYADNLDGPWTVHDEGVLHLEDAPALDHVASPDVHVDQASKSMLMYYHSVDDTATWRQSTYVATSTDGLSFETEYTPLAPPYLRVFKMGNTWWAIAKVRGGPGGVLLRAPNPKGPFRVGPRILDGMRHATVIATGEVAQVVFSRIGDSPERLLRTQFNPKRRWIETTDGPIADVLFPQFKHEGTDLPIESSEVGEAADRVRALRDPYIFSEDGQHYLFYSIAGEHGIGMARVTIR